MFKILVMFIGAMAFACGGNADTEPRVECEPLLVLANPGPSEERGCFRAVAGANSCVRLPGDEACYASVTVPLGESYEVLTCAEDWGAPTLADCAEVVL